MSNEAGHTLSEIASEIREALNAGLNAQALDLARGATIDAANTDEIRYLGALASARMGAIGEAEKWLAQVDREPLRDRALAVEVWSLAGRIAKERYAATRDKASVAAHDLARAAIDNYQRAFSLSGAAYPAVNAATMTMLAGDAPGAFALARQALATLSAPVDHW